MMFFISILFHFLLIGNGLHDQYKPSVCADYNQVQLEDEKTVSIQLRNNGTFIKSESAQHPKYRKRISKRRNIDAILIFSTNLKIEFLITILDFPNQIPLNNFHVLNYSLRAPPAYFL